MGVNPTQGYLIYANLTAKKSAVRRLTGSPRKTRTSDTVVNSHLLYRLS